jgi:glycosyltransferase involved in cell wall biosynthesis
MKVVYMHYHLNPGGVSRVIELQIEAIKHLSGDTEMIVLCGNANKQSLLCGVNVLEEEMLNYLDPGLKDYDYSRAATEIEEYLRGYLTAGSVLHVHNANLGKNPALTIAVYRLASSGFPVVNQCHDFAEDRPANLAWLQRVITEFTGLEIKQVLYPDFPRYHIIVLNSSDFRRIRQTGIPLSRVHLLPNIVSAGKPITGACKAVLRKTICKKLGFDPGKRICTYPVRAIARKNIGEFILLAALFSETAHFAVTQPPRNPLELPAYQRWKAFCNDNHLYLKFEAGESVKYEELVNISDFCITTSIQEGFGMIYLEPWVSGTPVIGRELAMVTDDLKNYGLNFPRLYSEILVKTCDGIRDFKDLEQEDQEGIIVEVINQPGMKQKVFGDNPALSGLLDDISARIISKNQQVIRQKFSTEIYGKGLYGIYQEVSE